MLINVGLWPFPGLRGIKIEMRNSNGCFSRPPSVDEASQSDSGWIIKALVTRPSLASQFCEGPPLADRYNSTEDSLMCLSLSVLFTSHFFPLPPPPLPFRLLSYAFALSRTRLPWNTESDTTSFRLQISRSFLYPFLLSRQTALGKSNRRAN